MRGWGEQIPADLLDVDKERVRFVVIDDTLLPVKWKGFHPSTYRYKVYDDFMQKEAHRYEAVLHSDVRDVIFQQCPFDIVTADVSAADDQVFMFMEREGATIRDPDNAMNFIWMSACYGKEATQYARHPISCSGFVIGRSMGMAKYLSLMRQELEANHYGCEQNGIDQVRLLYLSCHT